MKKIFCILLSLVLCLGLIACGGAEKPDDDSEKQTTQEDPFAGIGEIDFKVDVEAVTVNPDREHDFDLDVDIPQINVEAVTIAPRDENYFDNLVGDWNINLDINTFDSNTFVNDSKDNFSAADQTAIADMDKEKLLEIAEKKANLLDDLAAAYEDSGISVQIDETTGTITLDSSVLFATDSYAVSASGKDLLKEFISIYTGVVFHDTYAGFVSQIVIEGHTDTSGEYDYNKTLSQKRADSVMAYLLSQEAGVDADVAKLLESTMIAVGYSWDQPIYDANGKVDMDASRRVSFRFLIDVE